MGQRRLSHRAGEFGRKSERRGWSDKEEGFGGERRSTF